MSILRGSEDIPFEASFRVVCNELLTYSENQRSLPPTFYECPRWCGIRKERRADYCDTCEVKIAEKELDRDCVKALDNKVGEDWKQFSLESLINTVNQIAGLEKADPDALTVQTVQLINILKSERGKIERIKQFNEDQKSKNGR